VALTPVYILAELGSTHDGSLGNCLRLIEACAAAGANAAKLQDHRGERIKGTPPWVKNGHESRSEYLQRTSFDENGWRLIRATCTACGVDLVVSPFSVEAVRLLEPIVDGYKVASGQVTNIPMLEAIRATGKRVFLSTGMTTDAENEAAWSALGGGKNVTAMHCTSEYPCAPERVGLNYIVEGCGFSDHTMGFAASLAAVDRGAVAVERHVTFHRGMYGTDASHSLTTEELARFVSEIRELEKMLASPTDKATLVASEEMRKMREAFLE
jgi:N,N'-diacetyllegionaminate synthase